MSQVLKWLEDPTPAFQELVWQQVEGRIARADDNRKAGYRDVAMSVIGDKEWSDGSRKAGLELLQRLKDPASVGPVVELLPQLPRELWPATGSALRNITGQNFGPQSGDGAAEVVVAVKKWRTWLEQQKGR